MAATTPSAPYRADGGLARSTVRRAVKLLVDEGTLFVVPQRGTYVASHTGSDS